MPRTAIVLVNRLKHASREAVAEVRELERVEERLFAIRALARKHGVPADDLGGFAEGLRLRLAAIDGGAAGIARLGKAVAESEAAYTAEAARVTAALAPTKIV